MTGTRLISIYSIKFSIDTWLVILKVSITSPLMFYNVSQDAGNVCFISDQFSQVKMCCEVLHYLCSKKRISLNYPSSSSSYLNFAPSELVFLFVKPVFHALSFVVGIFWAKDMCSLALEDPSFRMRITLGAVLIRSLVCARCGPGCLRSGFGVTLD